MDFLFRQRIKDEVMTRSTRELMRESWVWLARNRNDPEHSAGAILDQERHLQRLEEILGELDAEGAGPEDPRRQAARERLAGFCTRCRMHYGSLTPPP
jgi:hypothetical protein